MCRTEEERDFLHLAAVDLLPCGRTVGGGGADMREGDLGEEEGRTTNNTPGVACSAAVAPAVLLRLLCGGKCGDDDEGRGGVRCCMSLVMAEISWAAAGGS